jgi:hypothetical protein
VIGKAAPVVQKTKAIAAIWAVEGALLVGIATVFVFAGKTVMEKFAEGTKTAIGGALLATMNTASEYGFGAVIAALPGFLVIADALRAIPNPLVNEAITVTVLAGITGSASGGMRIALAAMSETFIERPRRRHSAGGLPPRGVDGLGRHGHPAAQRRGDHPAGRDGPDPPPVLQGYLRHHLHQDLAVFVIIATFYLTGIV